MINNGIRLVMNKTTFIITDNGDSSVGIPGGYSTVTVDSCVCDCPSSMEATKEALREAFEAIHDFPVRIQTVEEYQQEEESLTDFEC